MVRRGRFACLALVVIASACSPSGVTGDSLPARQDLVVMAAASLSEAFTQLGSQFEGANPSFHVVLDFAGSQQLAQQLAQGAPADVFASANGKQMQVAIDAGRVAQGSTRVFATNRLTVISSRVSDVRLTSPADLARPGLKLVLAAQDVPAGQYALEFLGLASTGAVYGPAYQAAVLRNVVSYEENVRSVVAKVALGEADAGIVYITDVTADASGKVTRLAIPDELNVVASYPIAAISGSAHLDAARAFVEMVLSSAGQAVLARFGFSGAQP